ncbi:MAG: mannose-6-phosphate isomerase-like protein (cupin superfamily) [Phycisphaerales bacterium]|jgi:mannose-6-phosphate isomerase-like protein (cupin superfamily)
MSTPPSVINLDEKLSLFDETWTPKIIGELNGQLVKLAKLHGELTWHDHADEDELFLVLEGSLTMQYRDADGTISEVQLSKGDMHIVPRGVEHNPVSPSGASVLLFEPASTKHTGHLVIDRTVTDQQWI